MLSCAKTVSVIHQSRVNGALREVMAYHHDECACVCDVSSRLFTPKSKYFRTRSLNRMQHCRAVVNLGHLVAVLADYFFLTYHHVIMNLLGRHWTT